MSSAKTPNLAAFREERVILGVVTKELFSALPFHLFFADFLVVQKSRLPLPMGDFAPSVYSLFICVSLLPPLRFITLHITVSHHGQAGMAIDGKFRGLSSHTVRTSRPSVERKPVNISRTIGNVGFLRVNTVGTIR